VVAEYATWWAFTQSFTVGQDDPSQPRPAGACCSSASSPTAARAAHTTRRALMLCSSRSSPRPVPLTLCTEEGSGGTPEIKFGSSAETGGDGGGRHAPGQAPGSLGRRDVAPVVPVAIDADAAVKPAPTVRWWPKYVAIPCSLKRRTRHALQGGVYDTVQCGIISSDVFLRAGAHAPAFDGT
jgi:hypothetical protein